MAGGAGGSQKAEELQAHPVKEQLPGVQYCVNSPPPWRSHSLFYVHYEYKYLYVTIFFSPLFVTAFFFILWNSSGSCRVGFPALCFVSWYYYFDFESDCS